VNNTHFFVAKYGVLVHFEELKAKFGDNTKVLIAVGGWGDAGFSIAAANATTRELFASN